MTYIKVTIGIFLALAASRFIPHPPNFTSLIALSFYLPALLGVRFIPALILSFIITDFLIGFHATILFTWGSVVVIGLGSKYFISSIFTRISGAVPHPGTGKRVLSLITQTRWVVFGSLHRCTQMEVPDTHG